jgi:hypothetical protein
MVAIRLVAEILYSLVMSGPIMVSSHGGLIVVIGCVVKKPIKNLVPSLLGYLTPVKLINKNKRVDDYVACVVIMSTIN